MVYQVRQLAPDERPVEELEQLAEALSGRRVGTKGDLETIPADELLTLRREVRARSPGAFAGPVQKP